MHRPIIFHKNRRRNNDVGARGGWNQWNQFTKRLLVYRNTLCQEERYASLRTHAAKRRVQEMLLRFVEVNGGRVVKSVPGRAMYYYVVSRDKALSIMAAKLREGPDRTTILDDASIRTFPMDHMDRDEDFNVTEINF